MQTFQPELTAQQLQVFSLLGLPPSAYTQPCTRAHAPVDGLGGDIDTGEAVVAGKHRSGQVDAAWVDGEGEVAAAAQ